MPISQKGACLILTFATDPEDLRKEFRYFKSILRDRQRKFNGGKESGRSRRAGLESLRQAVADLRRTNPNAGLREMAVKLLARFGSKSGQDHAHRVAALAKKISRL